MDCQDANLLKKIHHVINEVCIPDAPGLLDVLVSLLEPLINHRGNTGDGIKVLDSLPSASQIKVIDGQLVCPDTKATFAVKDGIPKMIFEEGDVTGRT